MWVKKMTTFLSNYEVIKDVESFGYKLERFHGLFYSLWSISSIDCSDKISTAGISWDTRTKQICLMINPTFWSGLNEHTKLFVLCHEMLHVALHHPQRTRLANLDPAIANIAQDVCINEMLVNNFAFNRSEINNADSMCWLDTVPFIRTPEPNREFEYYYNLLVKNATSSKMPQLVDDHGNWNFPDDLMKEILGKLENEELEDLAARLGGKEAGVSKEIGETIKVKKNVTRSQRWKKIFKHWTETVENITEDWLRKNRRMSMLSHSKFILPCEYEKDTKKEKANIYLFLDTSGSCYNLRQDFYDAANSIPKKHFNVKMFGFTDYVYEVKGNSLSGFGGTSFSIIEDFLKKEKKYPEAVFIITDGYGNNVLPKHPSRWYWFLSKNGCKSYCHPKSHVFWVDDLQKVT